MNLCCGCAPSENGSGFRLELDNGRPKRIERRRTKSQRRRQGAALHIVRASTSRRGTSSKYGREHDNQNHDTYDHDD